MSIVKKLLGSEPEKLEITYSGPLHGPLKHKPIFIVGTGRSGTHFMNAIMTADPGVMSFHTDTLAKADSDSFLRYCVWNDLPVDMEPMRQFRYKLMKMAEEKGQAYFESNAYLSMVVDKLVEWYDAKVLLLIRQPENVVNSHYVKGWYTEYPARSDANLLPGFPPEMKTNHFFGRIMPNGDEFASWDKLTRIGKIGWWWNTLNTYVKTAFDELPKENCRVVKLDDFDYNEYSNLHDYLGGRQKLTETEYEKIRTSRPGKGRGKRDVSDWSTQELQEFVEQTKSARELFGYDLKRKS